MRYNRKCKMAYLLGFNNNIRCIEIAVEVLNSILISMFNNNIRCIEIIKKDEEFSDSYAFNNNIRCIEMLNGTVENGLYTV